MKFVIFSDLHLHTYRQFDVEGSRLKNCLLALRDVFDYCREHKIKTIFFGGDMYHLQKILPVEAVNDLVATLQELFQTTDVDVFAISGNHDFAEKNLLDKPGTTALAHLSEIFPRFHLMDRIGGWCFPGEGITLTAIPYYDYREHFQEVLKRSKTGLEKANFNIALIHQTPRGLIDFPIPDECDPQTDFEEFQLVLCGHIHTRRQLAPNFWLVGSTLAQSYQDPVEDRGFMVFDIQLKDKVLGGYLIESNFIKLDYPQFFTVREGDFAPEGVNYVKKVPAIVEYVHGEAEQAMQFHSTDRPKDLLNKYFLSTQKLDNERLAVGLRFVGALK